MALTSASSEKTMASGSGNGRSSRSEIFIRGYHERIWNPEFGEVAKATVAMLEDDNTHDRYAITKVHDLRISSLSIERSNYASYSVIFQIHIF